MIPVRLWDLQPLPHGCVNDLPPGPESAPDKSAMDAFTPASAPLSDTLLDVRLCLRSTWSCHALRKRVGSTRGIEVELALRGAHPWLSLPITPPRSEIGRITFSEIMNMLITSF